MWNREHIEAQINTMAIQRHNLEQQLTMCNGAIDMLQHMLSNPPEETETITPNEAAKNGEDNDGITTADD